MRGDIAGTEMPREVRRLRRTAHEPVQDTIQLDVEVSEPALDPGCRLGDVELDRTQPCVHGIKARPIGIAQAQHFVARRRRAHRVQPGFDDIQPLIDCHGFSASVVTPHRQAGDPCREARARACGHDAPGLALV
jgi:hypothetical protein